MNDLISRQAVIDAINVYMNGYEEHIGKPDDSEVFAHARGLIVSIESSINALPSAEPVIIRCKDCKYWHREIHNDIEYFNFSSCDLNHYGDGHNFYCADAERKNDG